MPVEQTDHDALPLHAPIALEAPRPEDGALAQRLVALATSAGLDLFASTEARTRWLTLRWAAEAQAQPFVFPVVGPGDEGLTRLARDLEAAIFLRSRWRDDPHLTLAPLSRALGLARETLREVVIPLPGWMHDPGGALWTELHREGLHPVSAALAEDTDGDTGPFAHAAEGALSALIVGLREGPAPDARELERLERSLGLLLGDPRWRGEPWAARREELSGALLQLAEGRTALAPLAPILRAHAGPLGAGLAQARFAGGPTRTVAPASIGDTTYNFEYFHIHQTIYKRLCVAATRPLGAYLRLLIALGGATA